MTKRLSIDEVKMEFESRGLIPIDIEGYKNNQTKINCYDKDGYGYYVTLTRVKSNSPFNKFHQDNPHTLSNIKNWVRINDPDYELLSEKYNGSNEKLKWRQISRPDLPPFSTNWSMFYAGNRHPIAGCEKQVSKRRKSPEEVRKLINDRLSQDFPEWCLDQGEEYKYKNTGSKIHFTHIEGYKSATVFATFTNGKKGLDLFRSANIEESTHNMYLWVSKNTKFKLIEGQIYTDYKNKYQFLCPEHGEFEANLVTVHQHNTGCWDCICEAKSGENSWNWNNDKSQEEREIQRKIEGYADWRRKVFERDWYTCQCCEEKNGRIVAHHLDGYDWCKERRLDVSNGITLCKECHKNFHSLYGYGKNTEKQFIEYKIKRTQQMG